MRCFYLYLLLGFSANGAAQELFPLTEPASNMPSNSLGIRLNQMLAPPTENHNPGENTDFYRLRINPELMWGINKKVMLHANFYASNMYQKNFQFEGASIYLKYRFFSKDGIKKHFRLAYYAKASLISNPLNFNEINLSGDKSGAAMGLVATQLIHKFALSFLGGYAQEFNNRFNQNNKNLPSNAINYSLSSGYLLWPVKYKNFNQPNFNLYFEVLGNYNPNDKESFLDIAPAIQCVLKSRTRIDFGYRKQINGNMLRPNDRLYFLKLEYNIFTIKRT